MTLLRPTLDPVHARALRAAAKVALAFSTASVFGACGGQVAEAAKADPDAKTDPDGGSAEAATDTAAVPDALVDATACTVTADAATPKELACCAAKVKATFPADVVEPVDAGGVGDAGSPDKELVACCGEIVRTYDSTHDLGLTFQQARACCYALPGTWWEHPGIACTPWGPPMPPAMPGAEEAVS